MSASWTLEEAVDLCKRVEAICPPFGCHVALTGGTLYKNGERKDCDLLFYRIRQTPIIEGAELWEALEQIGLYKVKGCGWCHKAIYQPDVTDEYKRVDCFFPEAYDGSGPDGHQHTSGA